MRHLSMLFNIYRDALSFKSSFVLLLLLFVTAGCATVDFHAASKQHEKDWKEHEKMYYTYSKDDPRLNECIHYPYREKSYSGDAYEDKSICSGTPLFEALTHKNIELAIQLVEMGGTLDRTNCQDKTGRLFNDNDISHYAKDSLLEMLGGAQSENDRAVQLFSLMADRNILPCSESFLTQFVMNDSNEYRLKDSVRYSCTAILLPYMKGKKIGLDGITGEKIFKCENETHTYKVPLLMSAILDRDEKMVSLLTGAGANKDKAVKYYNTEINPYLIEWKKRISYKAALDKLSADDLTASRIKAIMQPVPEYIRWFNYPGDGKAINAIRMDENDHLHVITSHFSRKDEYGTSHVYNMNVNLGRYDRIVMINSNWELKDCTGPAFNMSDSMVDKINNLKCAYLLTVETGETVTGDITMRSDYRGSLQDIDEKQSIEFNGAEIYSVIGVILEMEEERDEIAFPE